MENINYSRFYDLSDLSMFVLDLDGRILSANNYFLKSAGYRNEDIINTKFDELIYNLDEKLFATEFAKVLNGKEHHSFIVRVKRKHRKIIYFELIFNIDNENGLIYVVGNDITGDLFNNNILQEIALSVPGSIFKLRRTKNSNLKFDFINKSVGGLFDEFEGERLIDFLELLTDESQIEFLSSIESSERDFAFKSFAVILKSNTKKPFHVNITPLRVKSSLVFYGIATHHSKAAMDANIDLKNLIVEKYNRNTGFFTYKFENFDIRENIENQKTAFLNGIISEADDNFAVLNSAVNKEEIIDKKLSYIMSDEQKVHYYVSDLIENKYIIDSRIFKIENSGEYLKVSISSTIVDNKLIELKGTYENVSTNILKQTQLETTYQNYKNIFDYTPVGLMVHDQDKIIKVNKKLLEYLEMKEEEFLGQFPSFFVSPESQEAAHNAMKKYANNTYTFEPALIKVKTKTGKIKDFQASPHPIEYNGKHCVEVAFVDLTDTYALQHEVKKTKDMLESILDHSPNYIVRVNSQGIFTYCNLTYRERLGEDLTGKFYFTNISETDNSKLMVFVERLMSNPNSSETIVLNRQLKNGEEIKAEWHFSVFYEDDELLIQGIGKDITELEEIKSELEVSEQKYRLATNIAKIAYWEFDPINRKVAWSDEIYKILGYSKNDSYKIEDMITMSHPEDVNIFITKSQQLTPENNEFYYKHRMLAASGKYHTMDATVRANFNENKLVNFFGIIRDITEEEEKSNLIKRNELFYQATLEAIADGVVLQDRNDKVIMHNKAAEEILGLTSGQLLGIDSFDPRWKTINTNYQPLDGSQHPSVISSKTGKAVRNFIMGVYKPNGKLSWLLINSEPVSFNNDGKIDATATSYADITLMLEYQKEIAVKENHFRAIFNYSPNGKIVCDSNNSIVLANNGTLKLFGKSEEEIVGQKYESLFVDNKSENELMLQLLNQEIETYNIERTSINSNGDEVTLNIVSALLLDDDKQFTHIIRIFEDITESKKVKQELENQYYLLNEMGFMSKTGAWEYYLETDKIVWSDSIYEIYGLEKGTKISNDIEEKYYSPYEIEQVKKDFYEFKNNFIDYSKEYTFYDAKGKEKIVRFKGKAVYDEKNKPYKLLGIIQDITEAIRRENEIKSKSVSLTQLKLAIDKSVIVSYTNKDGKFIEVNDKFEEIYGYSNDEIIGKDHKIVSSGMHTNEFWVNFWHHLNNGLIWNGELLNRKKDGGLVWFNATILPLKDDTGNIIQYLEILTDITLNKNYQVNLEKTVSQRTQELTDANSEKDFILRMVSHDLKNPLTGILLQSEILKRYSMKNEDSFLTDKVNYLIDNTKRMNLIINNLLEFESIKSNTSRLLQKVNLNVLLSSMKSNYNDRLKLKEQELIISIPQNEVIVVSNKDYLQQIVDNLISNASKFSMKGKKIYVSVEQKHENIVISVKDEGLGIKESEKNSIFKSFVKLSNKPTGDENSSGLGLSIVKKMVDLLGHRIDFESEVNIGTIFSIYIKV